MKGNKKTIIISLALAMVMIIISVYITTSRLSEELRNANNQLSMLQNQINNMESNLKDFQENVQEEIKAQNSILSSYEISYSNADSKTLTGDITIELIPKEYSESSSATINLGDKVVPMSREGSTFVAVISVPIDIIYSRFIVDFKDGDTIRSEVFASGDIGFVNELVNRTDVTFFGEMSSAINKHGYHGQVQVYVSEVGKSFSEIKLFAIKNDEVIWETEDFFYNKAEGNYTVDIDDTFTLKKDDKLHLALEIKDSYGFIYKMPLYETAISSSDGVTGASEAMESRVYDAEGKAIEFKNY